MCCESSKNQVRSNLLKEKWFFQYILCVCTDCPAGGARAVIKDGENGLLVPVNDSAALADAMCRVVSVDGLSEKLSRNSVKIREEQSLEKIIEKWMEIVL